MAAVLPDWPVEEIPDDAVLYMRAHQSYFGVDGKLLPGVFTVKTNDSRPPTAEDGLSMHWQKYCPTPSVARLKAKLPSQNAVVSLIAGQIRSAALEPRVKVVHSPVVTGEKPDQSHTLVKNFQKTASNRAAMMKLLRIEIELGDPVT